MVVVAESDEADAGKRLVRQIEGAIVVEPRHTIEHSRLKLGREKREIDGGDAKLVVRAERENHRNALTMLVDNKCHAQRFVSPLKRGDRLTEARGAQRTREPEADVNVVGIDVAHQVLGIPPDLLL